MTKKHFCAIASVLAVNAVSPQREDGMTIRDRAAEDERRAIARRLAELFGRDNPRFDEARFLIACGVTP